MLEKALYNFLNDPDYAPYNFELGRAYEDCQQYAGAVSFYIRAAEYTDDDLLSYESLLRTYMCFRSVGNREYFAETILLRAVALLPERPEAYFLLSQHYERNQKWVHAYQYAVLGRAIIFEEEPLKTDVGYPGKFVFKFQQAVTAWWVGRYMESLALFKELENVPMPETFKTPVKNNIKNLSSTLESGHRYGELKSEFPYYIYKYAGKYSQSNYHRLRMKFPGAEKIKENFSQAFQDMFVLGVLNGKRKGRFLEIGCSVPVYNNNTYLLEKEFGWMGTAIDINPFATALYGKKRTAKVITADATKIDYEALIEEDYIDYLQIDCEPASSSYKVLLSIPFHKCKFGVITFEHDNYIDENKAVREESRKYLQSLGYKLAVADVGLSKYSAFEDWWVLSDVKLNSLNDIWI